MIIWLSGLSGSGKSTLCRVLREALVPFVPGIAVLEGEDLRNALGNDLGHSREDRLRALGRLQGVVRLLARQEVPLVVACVYLPDEAREWNRDNLPGYFDVHLNASIDTVTSRDPRDVYKRARQGELTNVMGIDVPYENPTRVDLILNANGDATPLDMVREICSRAPAVRQYLDADQIARLGYGVD